MLTHLSERDGKAANTASTIAHSLPLDVAVCFDPIQNLLDGLVVTSSDIKLHRIHIVAFRINPVPAVESLGIEVFSDLCLVVDSRGERNGRVRAARAWDESRRADEKQRENGNGLLHGLLFCLCKDGREQ
jgi:hypothetical protein